MYVCWTETCSVFCEDAPNNGIVCDAVTYECLYGCKPGYAGTHCTIQCCGACKTCVASATEWVYVVFCLCIVCFEFATENSA